MAQIYRIYVNDRRIIITSGSKKLYHPDSKKIIVKNLYPALAGMVNGNDIANSVLFTPSPGKIMQDLIKKTKYIEAGGGLVRNESGQYLFIFRHGKWDLPKGKLEKAESPEEGSVREVTEECNITIRRVGEQLGPTWHAYAHKGRIALKKTYWYLMEAGDFSRMRPQIEEGITDLRWFLPGEFDIVRQNTYGLIRELLETVELM